MKKEKLLTNIAIIYFLTGLLFATVYSINYKWGVLSFLSPGFYAVALSWPAQIPGFYYDVNNYGFRGKPLGL